MVTFTQATGQIGATSQNYPPISKAIIPLRALGDGSATNFIIDPTASPWSLDFGGVKPTAVSWANETGTAPTSVVLNSDGTVTFSYAAALTSNLGILSLYFNSL